MYARILEFVPKLEKRVDVVDIVNNEVIPILKKHKGFLDAFVLLQINSDKVVGFSLWLERTYAEPYEREWFPRVQEVLKPYLAAPITVNHYVVESALGGVLNRQPPRTPAQRKLRTSDVA